MGIKDWFGNKKHREQMQQPNTGTGNSGRMTAKPQVTFRNADGKRIPKKK